MRGLHPMLAQGVTLTLAQGVPLILATALWIGCARHAPSVNLSSPSLVREQLLTRIARVPGAQVAISVREIGTGRALSINGDSVYHAASTMKVPVLFALYREIEKGTIAPNRSILMDNRFRSIADGSSYSLGAADDSDSSLYQLVGEEVPLRELATRMIAKSSNLATNTLIELLDPVRISSQMRDWGATTMKVLRGVEDNAAFRAGLNNTATANDLVSLFVALEEGRVGNRQSTSEMLAILQAQEFNDEIPAGLPKGTRIAHKTGWITAVQHDAGLVFPSGKPPYAIAILTKGIVDREVANRLMADCSRIIWDWLEPASR